MIRSTPELDSEARELLARVDSAYAPSPADRARVRARVLQSIAGVPIGGAPAAHEKLDQAADAARDAASGFSLGLRAKALVGAVVVGSACFGAGFFAGRHSAPVTVHPPSQPHLIAPARPAPPESPKAVVASAEPTHEPTASSVRAAPKVGPGSVPTQAVEPLTSAAPLATGDAPLEVHTSALWQETQLLQRAQRALGSGNPRLSQALLDELAEEFPNGVLLEERAAVRILTECAFGRVAEARAQASQFDAAYPQSVHAGRVRGSCAGSPGEGASDAPTVLEAPKP